MNSEERTNARARDAGYTPDQNAAHQFLTELRTRIATQNLPYQHGVESDALSSLFKIFGQARETIKSNPGCDQFADLAIGMLNRDLRPFTARWHKLSSNGGLESRDGADEFRSDLSVLQVKMREHVKALRMLAYGNDQEDEEVEGPFSGEEWEKLFSDSIPYGIPSNDQIEVMNATLASRDLNCAGVEEINRLERTTIEDHRRVVAELAREAGIETETPPEGMNAVGLSCSGGGVRSATFSLGVIQILADKGLLKNIDYLSTVSGGGFVGSFLTRRMELPDSEKTVGGAYGPDPEPVRYLRQRAKYLTSQSLWEAWGMVTSTVAGMMMNWMVPLLVLIVLAVVTDIGELSVEEVNDMTFWRAYETHIYGFLLGLTFLGAVGFFFSLKKGEKASKWTGWFFTMATFLLVLGVIWKVICMIYNAIFDPARAANPDLLPRVFNDVGEVFQAIDDSFTGTIWGAGGFSLGTAAILLPVVLRFIPFLRHPKVRAILHRLSLLLSAAFIPIAAVAFYLFLCAIGKVKEVHLLGSDGPAVSGLAFLTGVAVFLFLLTSFFLNINLTAPHRLYRNGLAGTFVRRENDNSDSIELTKINERIDESGERTTGFAPYHLINAAANLPTSRSPGLRERMCDFFLFSKHFCGSPVSGYRPTEEWKMNGKPADLASAMAISGAAFSSNMGMSSIRPLRAILTFLNVRLGFWIRRPHMPGLLAKGLKLKHPGFSFLLREMAGVAMSEKHRWMNLSDGGHIENLAVYELLRRRCKFVICIDGECDPDFRFHGLVTLVRHARIDLGVRISPELSELRRDEETGHCRFHTHLCRIHYPDAGEGRPAATGLFLYVKLSTTGNESELIRKYQGTNPDFPHQTTMDQFFDEEQFEAYRQLGAHAGSGLFASCLTSGNTEPKSVESWFKSLSKNLLLPE